MPYSSATPISSEPALIAICVPTFMRPAMLERCLQAIAQAIPPEHHRLCLIVVDNANPQSALDIFERARPLLPFESYYFHEPQRGFSSVRNRLLLESLNLGAQYLAFVDDDELPSPDWLVQHIRALKTHGADVSHGPVIPVPEGQPPGVEQQKKLAKKKSTGTPRRHVNGGNVLFDVKLADAWGLRFDPFFDRMGGEDHDFFARSKARGAEWVWVKEAVIYETLPVQRQTLRYLFIRHYFGGINNVLDYAHKNSCLATWVRFLLKMTGKAGGIGGALLLFNSEKLNKNLGAFCGYYSALSSAKVRRCYKMTE